MKICNQQPHRQIVLNNQHSKMTCVPKTKPYSNDTTNFTGHIQTNVIKKNGYLSFIIHQTAFNREPKTKNFVCNYIRKEFSNKEKIKIISGGCSTGEEPVTYSMLLDDLKDKVDILGIDIEKSVIKQAKSRRYVLEVPNDYYKNLNEDSPFVDTYLLSDKEKSLTKDELNFKKLFYDFFEPTGEKLRTNYIQKFINMILKYKNINYLEVTRYPFRLKEGKAENCRFLQDDIVNIDKHLNGEKADVITFCNALYHLTTETLSESERIVNIGYENTINNLMTKFKKCLNKNGIIVFGEDEGSQLLDYKIVPRVMKKLGFIPLNKTKEHEANVWKLGD